MINKHENSFDDCIEILEKLVLMGVAQPHKNFFGYFCVL